MGIQGIKLRRWFSIFCAGLLLGCLGIYFLRGRLIHAVFSVGLQRAGAGDIQFAVAHSSPWSVQLDDLVFKIKTQQFAAEHVTMVRARWWEPTLGAVRVEGARVPVTIDGSDVNPFAWASYSGETSAVGGGIQVPLERLTVDGQLIVKTSGHEQSLALKFSALPATKNTWRATLEATGTGLTFKAEGSYGLGDQRFMFHSTTLSLELMPWQEMIQQLVVLPLGPWTMEGKLTGDISGTYVEKKSALGGRIKLSQGRLKNSDGTLAAEGIEADLAFTDLIHLQSDPGILSIRELRAGNIVANDLESELVLLGAEEVAIHRLTLNILGGSMAAEPFKLTLGRRELEAVVSVDNLDVEKLIALSKNSPATGSGRVDGRLPLRLDEHGLRLGTGWLQLKKGVYAEMQLNAAGIITGGMSPKSPSYVVMKRVESGLLRLKLGSLRLDVRPPDAQRGQTARLHLEGEPVDPSVKAPVILDININGPLEQLLNFGFRENVSLGTGK